ncbi:histidine kinase [Tamilnaduibacter salinus]|uniref:C4-dicarboxylate transport sensor protein DctB n=1 Tax=Tamilnaduibacter salinus TaxID=1484056 RepID=A0A2A2I5R8_9GAMM|nr:ATP-binding protein [Tamilnaduibacter salinus]PAV26485.1 histidine kinase [Tamilnaduibacter salinus]
MSFRAGAILAFIVTLLTTWIVGGWVGYDQIEQDSQEEAFRYRQLVANELNRYLPIPELIAEHPLLTAALTHPGDEARTLRTNRVLQRMAHIIGSSAVYLMDRTGRTIAANNHQQQGSFIGRNFSFRPYFQDALQSGQSAIYFALGTTSDVRGLYFSHPVKAADGRILGVVAVKVQVDELESQWHGQTGTDRTHMVVLDTSGVSFLASREAWLYRDFQPDRGPDTPNRRYADQPIKPVALSRLGSPLGASSASHLVRLEQGNRSREYLSVQVPLPRMDWTLQVMARTYPALWTRIAFMVAGTLIYFGACLTWLYLRERHRRESELAERGEQLERRVAERTADLERSNRQLLDEIEQREKAQTELQETQQELIQAAKLAVLGQMSAGLNHEMNQPLTAIQTYARNSRRFLERGAPDMVDANLSEILELCDKMAELTRQFKVFARKSEGPPASVDLRLPIDAALKIVQSQATSEGVAIDWRRPEAPVLCHGDTIRIEQVMVNLIGNATQAVDGITNPRVAITIERDGATWVCRVQDNGPGLPADSDQIFEPFYTTKSMKQGLGLGLSISRQIVDALGGRLTGHNRPDGDGAEFILVLNAREETA